MGDENNSPQKIIDAQDNIIYCKEKLFMRKDSYLYFVSTEGSPLDEGSRQLKDLGKLPRLENLTTGEPIVIKANKKLYFVLPLRGESKDSLWVTMDILAQMFKKLGKLLA